MPFPLGNPEAATPSRNEEDSDRGHDDARSRRYWGPVGVSAVLALFLGGGLLVGFGRVSPYDRPEVLDGLSNAVFWPAASTIWLVARSRP